MAYSQIQFNVHQQQMTHDQDLHMKKLNPANMEEYVRMDGWTDRLMDPAHSYIPQFYYCGAGNNKHTHVL